MSAFYLLPANHNVKSFNKHAVVDLIRFAGRGITRTDIAEELGLTRASVTMIINDLIQNGIILESESRSTRSGRPPVVLEIQPACGLVAAIDMGASHLSVALGDCSAHILDETEQPFRIADGPKHCLEEADRALKSILEKNRMQLKDLFAIGVGVPGPVIIETGMVMAPPIMPGWDRFPIRDTLEDLWNIPVSLNNDANFGALGEWVFGAGRGEKNLAFIKVGSGIGAGLIIHQQIFGGTTGSAGEIGHLTIDENGPLCTCGNHGCLEAFAGGRAIEIQAQKLVESGKRTLLSDSNAKNITVRDVADVARRGDLAAQDILHRSGTFIGIAVAGLINLVNPSVVIIGGGVAEVGDLLTAPIRKVVRERSLRAAEHAVKITTAMLGRRSTLIGAMVQATNMAVHNMIEQKNPSPNKAAYTEQKQLSGNRDGKEVILATEEPETLQPSNLVNSK
ncbi:MAG TPA: ROK family transcriptional regulator [Anaerolineales bacterium]|nr:ROK family transcriptional regulator [Anaerolineales bacterium]